MTNVKYFADIAGEIIELTNVRHNGSPYRAKAAHFSGTLPTGERVTATRFVQRKSNPSNHKCGAKCLNATGFLCECQCGGKDHGAGNFVCN